MKSNRSQFLFPYLMGIGVASLVLSIIFLGLFEISLKVQVRNFYDHMVVATMGNDYYASEMDNTLRYVPSQGVIDELNQKGGNFDNTQQLTKRAPGMHTSFAIELDEATSYRLRSDVSINSYFLFPSDEMNLDPPLLYLDNSQAYSDNVIGYAEQESVIQYKIESDKEGFRKTYPEVRQGKKILVVGDSVAFGLGVGDEDTFPSALQRRLAATHQVYNAALSGYDTSMNFAALDKYRDRGFDELVYVICANDIDMSDVSSIVSDIEEVFKKIQSLRSSFKKVTVVFHRYIHDVATHFLYPDGYEYHVEQNQKINAAINAFANEMNIHYVSWFDLVQKHLQEKKTIFAPMSLYVDHCHFSKEGNELLAQFIVDSFYSHKEI